MYKVALLVLVAALAPQAAAARVKVIGEIPKDYRGRMGVRRRALQKWKHRRSRPVSEGICRPLGKVRCRFSERNTGPERRYLRRSIAMHRLKPDTEENVRQHHHTDGRRGPDCRRFHIR